MGNLGKTLPPGLDGVAFFGFDALKWEFTTSQLFRESYDQSQQLQLPHGLNNFSTFDVPDGAIVSDFPYSNWSDLKVYNNYDRQDDNSLSVSLSESLGIDIISADFSAGFMEASHIEAESSILTVTTSYHAAVYKFAWQKFEITPDFDSAVRNVFGEASNPSKEECTAFFQKWGTHILLQGFFGGSYHLCTTAVKSANKRQDTQTITASVGGGFEVDGLSASSKIEFTQETATALSTIATNESTNSYTWGGLPNADVNSWMQSIDSAEALLSDANAMTSRFQPTFQAISELFTADADKGIRDKIKAAITIYLGASSALAPVSESFPVSLSENYCPTDSAGFLSVWAPAPLTSDANLDFLVYTSEANPPPASRQEAAGGSVLNRGGWKTSTFVPIRMADYYRIESDPTPCTAFQAAFQPYPLVLGQAEAVTPRLATDPSVPIKFDYDGFLCGRIWQAGSATIGELACNLQTDENQDTLDKVAATAIHWLPDAENFVWQGGFCVPVRKGAKVEVVNNVVGGAPCATKAWFVPISGGAELETPRKMQANQINTVDEEQGADGFITLMLCLPQEDLNPLSGSCAEVVGSIQVASDDSKTSAGTLANLISEVSASAYLSNETFLCTSTATGFVQAKQFWEAVTCTGGFPNPIPNDQGLASVWFHPIRRT